MGLVKSLNSDNSLYIDEIWDMEQTSDMTVIALCDKSSKMIDVK